ncbi:MAG: cyclic nucleotide-binding domain-containing protein [Nitrososphaerales archaeon]|nr:cyclic nucleotide-binding domain-containing protein [Nitrososphaerales archaeon]
MPGGAELSSAISSVPFFSKLDKKQIKALVEGGRERRFKAGDKVVSEGDMGIGFYMILEGNVEVRKGGRVLATLSKGQFFGEMSLIDEERRSADVVAVQPTRCFLLTPWIFSGLVKKHPEVAMGMLKELAKRLRAAQSAEN